MQGGARGWWVTGWRGEVRGHVLVDGKPELTVLGTRTGPESRGREMEKHRNRVLRPVMENLRLGPGIKCTYSEAHRASNAWATASSTHPAPQEEVPHPNNPPCQEGPARILLISEKRVSACGIVQTSQPHPPAWAWGHPAPWYHQAHLHEQ